MDNTIMRMVNDVNNQVQQIEEKMNQQVPRAPWEKSPQPRAEELGMKDDQAKKERQEWKAKIEKQRKEMRADIAKRARGG